MPSIREGYRGVAGLARSGPGATQTSLMSIFPQAWIQVFASGAWHPGFWTVFPCAYGGTRIAGRNVTLPEHRCHLVRIGEDLHDRLGLALASRTIGRIFGKQSQERASPRS